MDSTYWSYPTGVVGTDLVGFHVEAQDGRIGSVDETSTEVDRGYLVVDTGPWIFGRKVMLPAGVVESVDLDERIVYVGRTKEQIKDAPEFEPATYREPAYATELSGYYWRPL